MNMLLQNRHRLIFKALVGSHAYGTSIPESDFDYKGIYIQDPEDIFLNGYKEQIELSKDEVYFEVGRFLSLCQTGNPTVLELLFTPPDCIVFSDPLFQPIVEIRDIFITKALRLSFGGYAIEQIRKAGGLQKKINWENSRTIRKSVEDFCSIYDLDGDTPIYRSCADPLADWLRTKELDPKHCGLVRLEHFRDCFLLFHDATQLSSSHPHIAKTDLTIVFNGITSGPEANDVCVSEIPEYMRPKAIMFFHRDAYSSHCKEYKEYQDWLKKRNTQRYVDVKTHGQRLDGKNMLHCVRLIETALEIPVTGTINVRRPNADFLIEIRRGKHDLETILAKCEEDLKKIDIAFVESNLPPGVSKDQVAKFLEAYRQDYLEKMNQR